MYYNSNNKVVLLMISFNNQFLHFGQKIHLLDLELDAYEKTKDGNIIIGTVGGGAWKYNAKSVNTISSVDGFSDGYAWNMIADNENNLWASTNSGLIKINDVKY